mmetsp:Transcript_1725/g.2627  ORF Transcript_1725/g.2627 Transcript_1725/m.2627 type:complete len:253 (+) Transcript_1725:392-1150(+)
MTISPRSIRAAMLRNTSRPSSKSGSSPPFSPRSSITMHPTPVTRHVLPMPMSTVRPSSRPKIRALVPPTPTATPLDPTSAHPANPAARAALRERTEVSAAVSTWATRRCPWPRREMRAWRRRRREGRRRRAYGGVFRRTSGLASRTPRTGGTPMDSEASGSAAENSSVESAAAAPSVGPGAVAPSKESVAAADQSPIRPSRYFSRASSYSSSSSPSNSYSWPLAPVSASSSRHHSRPVSDGAASAVVPAGSA